MLGTLNTLATLLAYASLPQGTAEAVPPMSAVPAPEISIPAPETDAMRVRVEAPRTEATTSADDAVADARTPIPAPPADTSPALETEAEPTPIRQEDDATVNAPTNSAPVSDPSVVSPTERRAIIKAAGQALSAVGTVKGRFTQVAPDFSITTGEFALRRPGRVRFEYDAPVPILIVADGTTVAIEDSELETIDRVPLVSTPLKLVLDDNIDFESEAEITNVQRANGVVAITMRDRSGETDGTLTLILDARTYDLLSWRAIDGAGGITSVSLEDIEKNIRLSPRLFRLDDPEDADEDDRR